MPMLQVCSSFPIASDEALAGFGLWRDLLYAPAPRSKGSCERRGGSGSRLCGGCGAGDAEWLISGFRVLIISL